MDKSRKLTEDWKIRKRKSAHVSFKELIDFELSSPDEKIRSHMKITKTRNNHNNVSKNSKKVSGENTSGNCSNLKLRRSERIQQGSSRNHLQKTESQESQPLLQVQNGKNKKERNRSINESRKEKSSSEETHHDLTEWGLPPSVLLAYKSRNIHTMFHWQYECLSMKNVLEGGNLVFSAPTSAGKTLVAEILMLKKVTEAKKKAIMILPFVSVVREKVNYFQEMFQSAGIVVDGYMGAHNPPGGFKSVDIAICTIEKANNLINRLMEEKRLEELGVLVVDELHMIGDYGRGYLLELLLTKLLYNCKRSNIGVQIVGMSATLPNLNVISFWLQSELYSTDFRPVPLSEMFKVGSIVYNAQTKLPSRDLSKCDLSFPEDSDHSVHLSIETVADGHGVLIFCPSKNWCENLAITIAKAIYTIGNPNNINNQTAMKDIGEKLRLHLDGSKLSDIILQLKNSPAGLDSVLGRTIPFGVAFHHAGLTFDERDIVEGAFRQGILKVLVATTTLSSGVNLPARRVIIRSPLFCGAAIDVLSYKQMVGRAGRKGIDEEGESILLCKEVEKNVALTLVGSELKPVKSCLIKAGSTSLHSSLKRALIEVIASGVASSKKEVLQYVSCTLLFATLSSEHQDESSNSAMESSIDDCISYLIENDIIFKHEDIKNDETEITFKPSRLGLAILASGFSPEDALRVLKELQLARRCFVLENDLHLLYEVTPPYLSDQMGALNWMHFLSLWEQLPEEYKRVGELVGVQESFIGLGVQGRINKNAHKTSHKLAVHQRFYATLALNDLIQEMPLPVVSSKYDCSRGILQSLQQTTSTFAGMLTIFCNRLGWHNLELLFSSFQRRVHFGVQQELCDLIQLSTLNAQRARALYNAGFETVASLASADPQELALLLCNMGSFESAKQLDGDLAQEALQRSEAKRIRITGKQGVNEKEAAVLIVQEAQYFIKQELGLNKISWNNSSKPSASGDAISSEVFPTKEDRNKSLIANESIQINGSSEKSLTIQNYKSLPLNSLLHNDNTCHTASEDIKLDMSSSVKQALVPHSNEMNLKNETSNQSKNKTFFFDSCDKFSFLETSAKETEIKKVYEIGGLEDMKDDLCFGELLLSQTANGDNVYFAESLCVSQNSSNHDTSLNDNITKRNIKSEDLNFLNQACPMKESDFSFELPNMNSTKINLCLDSIFSELESTQLHENTPSNSQSFEKNNTATNISSTNKNNHNKENNYINPLIKNNPQINVIKTFHDHSTPLRSIVNSFASTPLNENINLKNIDMDILDKKEVFTDTEDKINNETSGELFDCEESLEEKQLNKNGPVNAGQKNSKDEMMIIENSNELFEDVSFDDDVKLFTADNCNSIQSKSEKEGSKTPCKKKCSTLNQCFETDPSISNSISKNSKMLASPKSKMKEPSQNELGSERNSKSVSIKSKDLVKKSLSPHNLSDFWKSWESSEINLSVSKCEDAKTEHNEKRNNDINKSDSLTLDSADNSLFKSFDSDCLSPTPQKKGGKSQILEKIKTPVRGFDSPIPVIKSKKMCNLSMEYFENLPISQSTPVCSDEVGNEYCIKIIDIPDTELEKFLKCLKEVEKFSFCVSCEKVKEKVKAIGPPKSRKNSSPKKHKCIIEPDIAVTGFAFCCGKASFFTDIADNLSEGSPVDTQTMDFSKKMSLLKQFFHTYSQTTNITIHDMKSQYKVLWQGCSISLKQKCMDPSVASWLLDPALGEQSLKVLVKQYLPSASPLLDDLGYSRGSLGLQHYYSATGKLRSSTEVYISYHLMDKLNDVLKEQQLYNAFIDIEMPSILALAKMEQNGLGFNATLAVSYQKKLEKKQQEILENSYKMAGRRFNILSSREVSRILFKELKLSPAIAPDSPLTRKYLSVGTSVRRKRLPPELKTNKNCLEKIIHLHPLPKAILDWRRLSFATTKVLMPLLRNNKYDNFFCMSRLYSTCYLYTLTGRVNVHSPNLQFVPRNFNVNSTGNESEDCQESSEEEYHSSEDEILQYGVSLRNLFIPFKGNVILAADYSQLELRILAHLSKEKNLLSSLNSGDDVFKKIASVWKEIPISSLTDEHRQQAKKICYGMIYGISANTLASQLNTSEEDASTFMETFKKSYPGLTKYFHSVTQSCLEKGYVTTLMNRRRYLPLIKSLKKAEQLQAERQAINTTIQGSAADLLKAAMIDIEIELSRVFPDTSTPYSIQNLGTQSRQSIPKVCRGGFLVLQMHDELIYEVCLKDLNLVVQIVKNAMEKTTKLLVDLPVKIRTGNSWGNLSEYRDF